MFNYKKATTGFEYPQFGNEKENHKKLHLECCSETWTLGKNEERVVNAFETLCWRRMLKIKWRDRIKNDEVFQSAEEERLLLKIKKKTNGRHSWIEHTIRHNEFVVNILEGAISGKKRQQEDLDYIT